jgi:hypothetical protein
MDRAPQDDGSAGGTRGSTQRPAGKAVRAPGVDTTEIRLMTSSDATFLKNANWGTAILPSGTPFQELGFTLHSTLLSGASEQLPKLVFPAIEPSSNFWKMVTPISFHIRAKNVSPTVVRFWLVVATDSNSAALGPRIFATENITYVTSNGLQHMLFEFR